MGPPVETSQQQHEASDTRRLTQAEGSMPLFLAFKSSQTHERTSSSLLITPQPAHPVVPHKGTPHSLHRHLSDTSSSQPNTWHTECLRGALPQPSPALGDRIAPASPIQPSPAHCQHTSSHNPASQVERPTAVTGLNESRTAFASPIQASQGLTGRQTDLNSPAGSLPPLLCHSRRHSASHLAGTPALP